MVSVSFNVVKDENLFVSRRELGNSPLQTESVNCTGQWQIAHSEIALGLSFSSLAHSSPQPNSL